MKSTLWESAAIDLQGCTVLLIDDEPANLGVLSTYLENFDLQVLVARDGESGLDKARYAQPDLILLDIRMPGIDGFETCRRLKADAATHNIPVIFITALTEQTDKVKGFEVGGVDYITKPFQEQEVVARVITHIRLQGLTHQLQEANESLERRVEERTAELAAANQALQMEVTERKQKEAEIRRRNRELALLNRVIAASVTETKEVSILEIICRELALAFDVPQAAATLLDGRKTKAAVMAEYPAIDRPDELAQTTQIEDTAAFQSIFSDKMPLATSDAQNDPRLGVVHHLMRQRNTTSLLIVPLVIEGEVVGSLDLGAIEPRQFSAEEINLAESVANQVSGVLARLRLNKAHRQLEAQYHQAQKMEALGRLTGGVAHDFNNLLTVIMGNCNFILNGLPQDHRLRPDVEQIQRATGQAAALTRQLLAFSHQQLLETKVLNLNDIVNNVKEMLHRVIGEDITLNTILEPHLGQVKADPGQIEQVIMNLVVNARDAMPNGGKLIIETANVYLDKEYARRHAGVVDGPYVMLAISDTGLGMDADTQTRIFEPFFTTKAKGEGTGLGLATVYGIVSQSEGHIWVYSEPEHGTTFKIYLPQIEAAAELVTPARTPAESVRGSETILLVEDEAMVRELARRALLKYGYTVLPAADGQQARQICAEHKGPIHLLLTDVVMPGRLSGPQLAGELTLSRPAMKVLYMSGYTDQAIGHYGLTDPDIAFISKPFAPDDLISKVREVLLQPEPGETTN